MVRGDRFTLVRRDGAWKIDGYDDFGGSPTIPAGYRQTDLELDDFSFKLSEQAVRAGPMAFVVRNRGSVEHSATLMWLADSVPSGGFFFGVLHPPREDVDYYGTVLVDPGEEYNMVLTRDLRPGRYALVCYQTGLDGRGVHIDKGMLREFRVR